MSSGFPAGDLAAERRRIRQLFNRVSGVLAVFDRRLRREYAQALERVNLPAGLDVLDLGTGTGSFAAALVAQGHRVTGVDFSERSLARARHSCSSGRWILADLLELDAVRSRSFDLVTLAYVLHGVPEEGRPLVLAHAARICRRAVLVLDYSGPGPWHVRAIEFLEGPHYRSFIASSPTDLLGATGLAVAAHGPAMGNGAYWLAYPARAAGPEC
jgi:ubiquinone/menaquinone biosynthesis C-methylase UbiE